MLDIPDDTRPPAGQQQPHPVDLAVGARIRTRRMAIGMSQEKLGERLGVTFQQVQKYEKGSNRVSASRLAALADALDVPVAWLFTGIEAGTSGTVAVPEPHSRQAVELARLCDTMTTDQRAAVLRLARVIAREDAA